MQTLKMSASTVIHAHACAAGAAASHATNEALGRSRGGFVCKIYAFTDALVLPVRFLPTEGQGADIIQATPLMQGIRISALLAHKGYDADVLLEWRNARDIAAIIPSKANRREQRICDWHQYKERHVIDCLLGIFKYFHRIAICCGKRPVISRKCWLLLSYCYGFGDVNRV